MPSRTPRFQKGLLTAAHLNKLVDIANWIAGMRTDGRIQYSDTAAGPLLSYRTDDVVWIKTTATSTTAYYQWQEVVRASAGGSWINGHRVSGASSTYAYEANGNVGVALGTIVPARFSPSSGELIFYFASC